MNNPSHSHHEQEPSTKQDLVSESLAWDMAHAAKPLRDAAHILKLAGVDNEAARLVSKSDTVAQRVERNHNKVHGIVTEPDSLLANHILNPVIVAEGPVPEDLLTYPTQNYERARYSGGGKIHNPELAEELAYVQAPYEDARKALIQADIRDHKEWTTEQRAAYKQEQQLSDNSRIAVRNAELEYYNRRDTSLYAVTAATKALFLDKLWTLDAQRKAASSPEVSAALEQEIRDLGHDYAPLAGREYFNERNKNEQAERDATQKAYNTEILASSENWVERVKDELLIPATKKGELPTLKLPTGLTNRIWEKFMTYRGSDVSPVTYSEQQAVAERLGMYWNQVGWKMVTEDEFGWKLTRQEGDDETTLHHKSIYAVVIDEPGHVNNTGFSSYEKRRPEAGMLRSSKEAKLGAAKLHTIIEETLAEPRDEAKDNFDPRTDPQLRLLSKHEYI
jgi:CRISPR/Cas system CMR-associated protein Cmr5 small subunit